MPVFTLKRVQVIPRTVNETFAFFAEVGNLQAITPDWLHFQILTPLPITMHAGTQIDYRLTWRWFPVRWRTQITAWQPPARFIDVQLNGPYRLWKHEHTFEAVQDGTLMRDVVRYALPYGCLGRLAHLALLRTDLDRIFDYRACKVASLLGFESAHA